MDFLDPRRMRRHSIMLFVGYGLIGIAIVATALILLYQSSGYGINKDGEVIQNGLVFAASTPNAAQIYIDGQQNSFQTNKRLFLIAGDYQFQYKKAGYSTWSHAVSVRGGQVSRPDYAFLFPTKLDTAKLTSYAQAPLLTTQSPDRRWLLVMLADGSKTLSLYDLKDLTQAPVSLTLPATVATAGTNEKWELVEWSNDNQHVLLRHAYNQTAEFILVDRSDVTQSVNLNKTLAVNPTEIKLRDKKYDQYYLYDAAALTLQTATLNQSAPLAYLDHVLAYKSYGSDKMLYVTDVVKQTTPTDTRRAVLLADGDQTYQIRRIPAGNKYLLDMAGYSGDTFIAAGVDTENKVIVYKNPVDQIKDNNIGVAVQVATLKVATPNYISFSFNARYIVVENAAQFAIYDAEDAKVYGYTVSKQLDAQAAHATWMDGNRLTYPSGGKLYVFDADHKNSLGLMNVAGGYQPAFTPDYKRVLTIAPSATTAGQHDLQRTWLRTTPDR
jgi:hypothetical protein